MRPVILKRFLLNSRSKTAWARVLAAWAICLTALQGQSVSLSNLSTNIHDLPAQTAATDIPIQIEEGPAGGGAILVITEDPAMAISLVLPSGTEITEANATVAGFGFTRADQRNAAPGVLGMTFGGVQTYITLPAGLTPGAYKIRANTSTMTRASTLLHLYWSSSGVRIGAAAGRSVYPVSTPVAISGFAFGQSGALSGVQMEAKIVRAADVSATVSVRSLGLPVSRQAISATTDRVAYRPEVINTQTVALPAVLGFCSPTDAAASASIAAVRCGIGPGDLAAGAVYTATATDTIEFDVPTGQGVTLSQLVWKFESRGAPVSVPLQDAGPLDPWPATALTRANILTLASSRMYGGLLCGAAA